MKDDGIIYSVFRKHYKIITKGCSTWELFIFGFYCSRQQKWKQAVNPPDTSIFNNILCGSSKFEVAK